MRNRIICAGVTFISLTSLALIGASNASTRANSTRRTIALGSRPVQAIQTRAPRPTQGPIRIDGAATPELISDELAYRHFLAAIASGGPADLERRSPLIMSLGLSPTDQTALLSTVEALQERLSDIEHRRRVAELDATGDGSLTRLRRERLGSLNRARDEVRARLDPAGAAKLDAHVRDRIKSRIVVYDYPTDHRLLARSE